MRIALACLLVAGCAGASTTHRAPVPATETATVHLPSIRHEGGALIAKTEPLDLDGNGQYEWLSMRFRLPVPEPGTYDVMGSVTIPTDSGLASDVIYPRGWDSNRASVPSVLLHCDTTSCPAEAWLSGRYLARAMADSVVIISLEVSVLDRKAGYFRQCATHTIRVRRDDWARFEWDRRP